MYEIFRHCMRKARIVIFQVEILVAALLRNSPVGHTTEKRADTKLFCEAHCSRKRLRDKFCGFADLVSGNCVEGYLWIFSRFSANCGRKEHSPKASRDRATAVRVPAATNCIFGPLPVPSNRFSRHHRSFPPNNLVSKYRGQALNDATKRPWPRHQRRPRSANAPR
jgi:hypothetical protein